VSGRRIGIIGAGAGGIATAVKLRAAGFSDLTILEQASGVGGTWWHNRYPGLTCVRG
jgi:cation diffusion facilitator CzcD-associated flavoprotein CzcO